MRTAAKFGVVAVIALAFTVVPGGGGALNVALAVLTMAFFAAIAVLAARLFREHRFELESLQQTERFVLYSSIGLALLTFTATNRLFNTGGAGVLVWLGLLALSSYGVFWVWTRYRRYE